MTLSVFARKDLEEKLAKVSKIHPFYLFYLTVYLLNGYKQILVILFDLKIYLFFIFSKFFICHLLQNL